MGVIATFIVLNRNRSVSTLDFDVLFDEENYNFTIDFKVEQDLFILGCFISTSSNPYTPAFLSPFEAYFYNLRSTDYSLIPDSEFRKKGTYYTGNM